MISINKENLRRYLLYAVGEVVLVVIGILLALEINNRNEFSKQHQEELRILQKLERELELDQEQLDLHISWTKDKLLMIDTLFLLFKNPSQASHGKIISINQQIPYADYFSENRGTYDEGLSSGKISYIQNDSLREQIFEYYRFVQQSRTDAIQVKFVEDVLLPQWGEIVIPTKEGLDFIGLENNLPSLDLIGLSKNKKYLQLVAQKYGTSQVQLDNWVRIKGKVSNLQAHVRNELEQCNL